MIVKWVHQIRGMKGWSRTSEHQARVTFLASIQGGWENLLPAPPAPQAMAQPLTGHVTAAERHSGCSGNSRTSPGHTARTQANTSGNALRQQSQNDDDDAEFLKDKTGADGRRERPLDDLMERKTRK